MTFKISTFLIIGMLLGFTLSVQAQEISPNAIGLRLGDANGFGASVNYQHAILEANRLEFDFGWSQGKHFDGVKLSGLFQWIKPLDGNFNWYFGAGAGLSSYKYNKDYKYSNSRDSFVFAAGDIGVEYHFDFPLLLSLDARPELGFGDDAYDNNNLDINIGVGVRYLF